MDVKWRYWWPGKLDMRCRSFDIVRKTQDSTGGLAAIIANLQAFCRSVNTTMYVPSNAWIARAAKRIHRIVHDKRIPRSRRLEIRRALFIMRQLCYVETVREIAPCHVMQK